jgi:LPLT family lysophospholipid transporter-like MFS transporter
MSKSQGNPLLARGMISLLVAQFFSALADNAVLIIAIAMVTAKGSANQAPLLQEAFVVPFILLAPFAGPVADGFPKGRVMLLANLLKLSGALFMAAGLNPLLSYSLIGVGATVYSPAKYGILSQLVGSRSLVRANGMLEASTIAAILLGVLMGGRLTDHALSWAFFGVIASYTLAAGANLFIPRLAPERPMAAFRLGALIPDFARSLRSLFSDPDARFSLLGTSIFWGAGVTLRLLLFAWVPAALSVTNYQTPANLMGIMSLGIVLGSAAAAAWISLETTNRALIGGVLLGPVILALAGASDLATAGMLMALAGLCGGLFVVPLNALLQETGRRSVGAGSALAVQNLWENLAMLLFVGGYSLSHASGVTPARSAAGFGIIILTAVAGIAALRNRRRVGAEGSCVGTEGNRKRRAADGND